MSEKTVGSKAEVFHGNAVHTSGGLHKSDLMKTKNGRIVSRKKHAMGKKAVRRLFSLGYKPKKGLFRLFTAKKKRAGGFTEDPSGDLVGLPPMQGAGIIDLSRNFLGGRRRTARRND